MTNLFDTIPDARQILGDAGTGKTTALAQRALDLLREGVPASDIALIAASPQGVVDLRTKLAFLAEDRDMDASGLFVRTARAFALDLLDSPEAHVLTGRTSHLLTPADLDMLIEDLKASGMREGRLRKMLAFFFRSWADLDDDEEGWLVGAEEDSLHSLLKANLHFTEGVLEPEAANLARNVMLRANDADFPRYDHVLVDDFQQLSRASQQLCCLCARDSITVSANPHGTVELFDSYPCASGIEEFLDRFPNTETIVLVDSFRSAATQKSLSALRKTEKLEDFASRSEKAAGNEIAKSATGTLEIHCFDTPQDEFRSIALMAAEQIKRDENQTVVMAVPNATWSANFALALRALGLNVQTLENPRPWYADYATGTANLLSRLLCALRLASDPENYVAWRTWCGYDDSMANSAAMREVRNAAAEERLTLTEALDRLAGGTLMLDQGALGTERVVQAYREGRDMLEQARGLTGKALLDCLSRCVMRNPQAKAPDPLLQLCRIGADDGSLSAQALLKRALQFLEGPVELDKGAVAVLPYRQTATACADTLFVTGFVNGFIPRADWFDFSQTPVAKQARRRAEDAQLLASLISVPRKNLIISSFTNTTLEAAHKLGLKIDRISMVEGQKMARTSPSIFLESLMN